MRADICRGILIAGAISASATLPATATESADPSALCLDAAADAARRTGVPYEVLLAVALVETGQDGRPWPWTVNNAGDGQWFDTPAEAEAHATGILETGDSNVDLGCFQLNVRWHSTAFASVADMLDPERNASYAAGFLAEHYAETGDWAKAAAAYHSQTPEYAEAYQAKFETTLAGLGGEAAPPTETEVIRSNRFPLLVAGSAGSAGSLVPAAPGGRPLIGAP